MKIVKPEAKLIKCDDPLELIEKVGRVCYKSEDKITPNSKNRFIMGLMRRQHFAMLEHGNAILRISKKIYDFLMTNSAFDTRYLNFSHLSYLSADDIYIVSGSFRAFRDMFLKSKMEAISVLYTLYERYPLIFGDVLNTIAVHPYYGVPVQEYIDQCSLIDDNQLISLYSEHPELIRKHITHTIHFVCDRGVSHEFVRHRNCAFAQESTRYCNYSKDKFGSEITVIEPVFGDKYSKEFDMAFDMTDWRSSMRIAESHYFDLLNKGATPQEARTVLPNSLKTELIITCNEEEWNHIISLRLFGTTGQPHPQMKEVMNLAYPLLFNESEGRVQ